MTIVHCPATSTVLIYQDEHINNTEVWRVTLFNTNDLIHPQTQTNLIGKPVVKESAAEQVFRPKQRLMRGAPRSSDFLSSVLINNTVFTPVT